MFCVDGVVYIVAWPQPSPAYGFLPPALLSPVRIVSIWKKFAIRNCQMSEYGNFATSLRKRCTFPRRKDTNFLFFNQGFFGKNFEYRRIFSYFRYLFAPKIESNTLPLIVLRRYTTSLAKRCARKRKIWLTFSALKDMGSDAEIPLSREKRTRDRSQRSFCPDGNISCIHHSF